MAITQRDVVASAAGREGVQAVRRRLAERPRDETCDLPSRRAALDLYARAAAAVPIASEVLGGVAVERHGPAAKGREAILYIHGGAFVLGSPATHRALAARLAELTALTVVAADYRLAPEHPLPAARDDLLAVYATLARDASAVAVMGDSAGGGLAVQLVAAARDAGQSLPTALAVTSPWVDLELRGASLQGEAARDPILSLAGLSLDADRYAGDCGRVHASPLSVGLRGFPPTLVQVAEQEVLRDDGLCLAARLDAAGVDVTVEVWEAMTHSWHAFGEAVPEAAQAMARVAEFLRAHLPSRAAHETQA